MSHVGDPRYEQSVPPQPPLTQYQALRRILLETAGTEMPTDLGEARVRIRRIASLVARAHAVDEPTVESGVTHLPERDAVPDRTGEADGGFAGLSPAHRKLVDLLRDETGWEWPGEEDEPAPTFGCDTRVPSSETVLGRLADQIITLLAEPVWRYTPEGHDDEYEYVTTSDCDGSNVRYWRWTPERRFIVARGAQEPIEALPDEELRRSTFAGEDVRS